MTIHRDMKPIDSPIYFVNLPSDLEDASGGAVINALTGSLDSAIRFINSPSDPEDASDGAVMNALISFPRQ